MIFHWSLGDSKSLQVSRTLLSILADLNNIVVWMVSTRPLISRPSIPFDNPSVTIPIAPIAFGINVTFMFLCYYYYFHHKFSFGLRSKLFASSPFYEKMHFLHNRSVRSIFDVKCITQIKSWAVNRVEKYTQLISMIDGR